MIIGCEFGKDRAINRSTRLRLLTLLTSMKQAVLKKGHSLTVGNKQCKDGGRACLQVWSQLCIATVIKRTEKKRAVEVIWKMTLGTLQQANALVQASLGGTILNIAFSERFNGTMRERLASLTHKYRHAAHRLVLLRLTTFS